MRAQYWEYENENGKKTRVRNPFAPPINDFVTKIGNAFILGKGQVFYMPEGIHRGQICLFKKKVYIGFKYILMKYGVYEYKMSRLCST